MVCAALSQALRIPYPCMRCASPLCELAHSSDACKFPPAGTNSPPTGANSPLARALFPPACHTASYASGVGARPSGSRSPRPLDR
eukprot:1431993-Pyramimonas_sp.AAC.2